MIKQPRNADRDATYRAKKLVIFKRNEVLLNDKRSVMLTLCDVTEG